MSENDANKLLFHFGECWMETNTDIVYLAVIKKSKENFTLEMGMDKFGSGMATTQVDYHDIPDECFKNEKLLRKNNFSNSLIEKMRSSREVIDNVEKVNKIKLLSVSNSKIRPILASSKIRSESNHDFAGTLGAFLQIKPFSKKIFFITNHHVLSRTTQTVKGDIVFQPCNTNNDYSNAIGKLKFGYFGSTPCGYDLDVAFVQLFKNDFTDKMVGRGFIHDHEYENNNSPYLQGIESPEYNMKVQIFGSATGFCSKEIISKRAYVRVQYGNREIKSKIFKNQILVKNISKSGDSGSVLINEKTKKVVGLIFAGDEEHISVANNINDIFSTKYLQKNYHVDNHEIKDYIRPIEFLNFKT